MRDLSRTLVNPFDDDDISMAELLAFSTDHLQRMIANNPGALFNTRITATTTSLSVVENCTTDDQTKLGLRKAKKMAKDAFRKALPGNVAKLAGVVMAKYGDKSPEMAECFPQGRAVFSSCTDDMVANHLAAMRNGLMNHQGDLGAPVVGDANGLLSTWTVVYAASESSTGSKTTTEAGKAAARQNLQLELFKNLLTIALNFPRQPDSLALYMQQSLLEDHPQQPPAPPTPPTPPPGP